MRKKLKEWLVVLLSLLDDIAVTIIIFFILRWFNIPITIPVIVFLIVFFGVMTWLFHRLIIPALRRKVGTGAEGMIGMEGQVVHALEPEGMVKIKNEYWQAKSVDGSKISVGEKVIVVRTERLQLWVRRK